VYGVGRAPSTPETGPRVTVKTFTPESPGKACCFWWLRSG